MIGVRPRPRQVPVAPPGAAAEPQRRDGWIQPPASWRERSGRQRAAPWRVSALVWERRGTAHEAPVVVLHGLAVGAAMCAPLAEHLADRRRVYAPDLPGFGRSGRPSPVLDIAESADAAAAWMHVSGLSHAVVVGVSIGCQIAADLALRHPERVAMLVLASPTVDARRRSWPRQVVRWQLEQSTQSMAMRRKMLLGYARAGVPRALRTFAAALHDRPEDKLPALQQPVLVCRGSRDPLVSRRWARHLADLAPGGRFVALPGAVHAMSHDSPLALARAIEHHLHRTEQLS